MSLYSVLIFYSLIIFLIYQYRDKFEIQGKIIALYRTKLGLKLMDSLSQKFPRFWKGFGYAGIVTGYFGLFFISYFLLKGLFDIFFLPSAPAAISLVLPGVKIPGSPVFIPFWSGIISIFIVAAIHEFAHGVVARTYRMPVKSSGIVFFGPIIGAFVEPDEEILKKAKKREQLSVFAAGPFSNICLGILIMLLMIFVISPSFAQMVEPNGIEITTVQEGFPAKESGLLGGEVISNVDGIDMVDVINFSQYLEDKKPGDNLVLSDGSKEYDLILTKNPQNESKGYMGITLSQSIDIKESYIQKYGFLPNLFMSFIGFLRILFMLTMGIGFANLLPLGPVDGGRILQVTLYKWFSKAKADLYWKKISLVTLLILLINIFLPLLRSLF